MASFVSVKRFNHGLAMHRRPHVVCMAGSGRFFVGGNWKCNGSVSTVKTLVQELNDGNISQDVDVVCAPPYVYLTMVKDSLKPQLQVAAQNCWVKEPGAYTGEVAADMLADLNIPWVILGHSERRSLLDESNEFVGEKCAYALSKGLGVIACIGETLAQRDSNDVFNVLDAQMSAIASHVSDWSKVVIAYEPVWAIGTGVVASPEQAQEVHAYLRKWLSDKVSWSVSKSTRIIYGGSVNAKNCKDLARQEDIDGFLVGGASLKGADFIQICNASQ